MTVHRQVLAAAVVIVRDAAKHRLSAPVAVVLNVHLPISFAFASLERYIELVRKSNVLKAFSPDTRW
jgi:hypothetical protein